MHWISFQTFFVWAFKIVVDSWEFTMLLLYMLWDDRPIFMISGSNEQLQQLLEYTLLKPDCHSWWISKLQSGREDTSEERYAIKFCFKLGKNATKRYGMLQTAFRPSCMNRASVLKWHIYIYILLCINNSNICVLINYVVPSISVQTFFEQAFIIIADSWKFTMLLLYIW